MKLERVKLEKLHLHPSNPRIHNERNIESIRASLQAFGQQKPIIIDAKNVVIAGNGTVMAARELKWKEIIAQRTALKGVSAIAYLIADNRTAELADWSSPELAGLLESLRRDQKLDIESLGFTAVELDLLLKQSELDEATSDKEEIPDLPKRAVTKPGDIISLGAHRILCGDSTNAESVKRLFNGKSPFMMVTDPPYGVKYDPKWRNVDLHKSGVRTEKIRNDDVADWAASYRLFPGNVAYVWHSGLHASVVAKNLIDNGFEIRAQIIWSKQNQVISRGAYHWKHEPCWYAVRKSGNARWRGGRAQTTIWEIANANPVGGTTEDGNTEHSTQKPTECMARPIRNHGGADDIVYDPFLGSGTTLIAAEKLNRSCLGLEIEPRWCDVIIERWQNLTGGKARRRAA